MDLCVHGRTENVMQDDAPTSRRIVFHRPRWRWHALRALALLAGAVCTPTLAGTLQGLMLASAPMSASPAAEAAGTDALHLPASWEGKLPGADGTVLWHLDLNRLPLGSTTGSSGCRRPRSSSRA
jgi:hypothetical protein